MKGNRKFIVVGLAVLAAGAQAQDQSTHIIAGDGTQVTLHSGQPQAEQYGPPLAFAQLDVDGDGFVSRTEAEAYIPLFNDFDHLAHHANRISQRQFETWVRMQIR
jgi:hypothetical protein